MIPPTVFVLPVFPVFASPAITRASYCSVDKPIETSGLNRSTTISSFFFTWSLISNDLTSTFSSVKFNVSCLASIISSIKTVLGPFSFLTGAFFAGFLTAVSTGFVLETTKTSSALIISLISVAGFFLLFGAVSIASFSADSVNSVASSSANFLAFAMCISFLDDLNCLF